MNTIHTQVSVKEAKETVERWYSDRKEVSDWQEQRRFEAREFGCVHTLLGRARWFPSVKNATGSVKGHIERAAINTPVQVHLNPPSPVSFFLCVCVLPLSLLFPFFLFDKLFAPVCPHVRQADF